MILLLLIGILILSIVGGILFTKLSRYASDLWILIPIVTGLISGIMFLALSGTCISNHITAAPDVAEYTKHYESLVYQVENNLYADDITAAAKRDLVTEVQKWNCDLASKKELSHNLWLGILYPDIYDQFNFISLDKLRSGE